MSKPAKKKAPIILLLLFLIALIGLISSAFWGVKRIRVDVMNKYGQPSTQLSMLDTIRLTMNLYLEGSALLVPNQLQDADYFEIGQGEPIGQILFRLQSEGFIGDAELFKNYIIYRGFDRTVQTGFFKLTPGMNALEIANKITDPTPDQVHFNVLAGWRAEEIAASLPRSGLAIDPQEFLDLVNNPPAGWFDAVGFPTQSLEGYLGVGEYVMDRDIGAVQFVHLLTDASTQFFNDQLISDISSQRLSVQEVVILASIVEREAVIEEEMPLIASVFINRYRAGIKLDSDPTVQYALGYNQVQSTWWSNPLTSEDLQIGSAYNTYLNVGLPPTPICNPSQVAINAVVYPQNSPYFYFRARCDNSGLHNFAESYDEHLQNGCP